MRPPEHEPSKKELFQLADILADPFVRRWDMYPKQVDDGYRAVKRPLKRGHLLAHLEGTMTLGVYVLDQESQARFIVLDADDAPDWRRLTALAHVLQELDCPSYLEQSRRGGHLWLFLDRPTPGTQAQLFGQGIMSHFGIHDIELFPKQTTLSSGPGSLIRMPFGIHRKSQQRYGFYNATGEPLAPSLREQIRLLAHPKIVPEQAFQHFLALGEAAKQKSRTQPLVRPDIAHHVDGEAPLPQQIVEALSVHQFVSQYVELSPGGKGRCPFHDDQVASLSVNDKENYWNCFAGCGGGNIINFWMLYNDVDYQTSLQELSDMLLQ